MGIIKLDSRGEQVKSWQLFLISQGLLRGSADGIFGQMTDESTKEFQKKYGLVSDGIVGNLTYIKAEELGFQPISDVKTVNPD